MSKKLIIEEMQAVAKERGGECLSREYVNSTTKLKWQCAEGHTWMATPGDVKNSGSWCPECARKSRCKKTAKKR